MAREQLELRKRPRVAERQPTAPPEKPAEAVPRPPPSISAKDVAEASGVRSLAPGAPKPNRRQRRLRRDEAQGSSREGARGLELSGARARGSILGRKIESNHLAAQKRKKAVRR
jgi:hypothetical protein